MKNYCAGRDRGLLLLRGVDRQIGLSERLCAAIDDTRHPAYITHPLHDLLKQRIDQIACGYEDGNDCNVPVRACRAPQGYLSPQPGTG